jgi:hypothetical protein
MSKTSENSFANFDYGIDIVRDLYKALEKSADLGQEHNPLVREHCALEKVLLDIKRLDIDVSFQQHKNAIERTT